MSSGRRSAPCVLPRCSSGWSAARRSPTIHSRFMPAPLPCSPRAGRSVRRRWPPSPLMVPRIRRRRSSGPSTSTSPSRLAPRPPAPVRPTASRRATPTTTSPTPTWRRGRHPRRPGPRPSGTPTASPAPSARSAPTTPASSPRSSARPRGCSRGGPGRAVAAPILGGAWPPPPNPKDARPAWPTSGASCPTARASTCSTMPTARSSTWARPSPSRSGSRATSPTR